MYCTVKCMYMFRGHAELPVIYTFSHIWAHFCTDNEFTVT